MKFDRIVLDTAPTGHTLRMLELPVFLEQLIQKIKSIRNKVNSMSNLGGMMGSIMGGSSERDSIVDKNDKLDKIERQMRRLQDILHNSKECEFIVVTIPTELAVEESRRLLASLKQSNIQVRRMLINQILLQTSNESSQDINDTGEEKVRRFEEYDKRVNSYLNKLRYGQNKSIEKLEGIARVCDVDLIKIPYFDMEVRSVYGLRALGNVIFPSDLDVS